MRITILVDHPNVLWLFLNFGSMRHSQRRHMLAYLQECLVAGYSEHQGGTVSR